MEWTPVLVAARGGHAECLKLLLAAVGNRPVSHKDGWSAMHLASVEGQASCLKVLLAAGSDVDDTNSDGMTPLIMATERGHKSCIQVLLEAGANVNNRGNEGMAALHWAVGCDDEDCLKMLLAVKGVDVNAQDSKGFTPKSLATSRGCNRLVKLLSAVAKEERTDTKMGGRAPASASASPSFSSSLKKPQMCAGCGLSRLENSTAPRLHLCTGCRSVAYCNADCQLKHWKTGGHKEVCGQRNEEEGGDKLCDSMKSKLGL